MATLLELETSDAATLHLSAVSSGEPAHVTDIHEALNAQMANMAFSPTDFSPPDFVIRKKLIRKSPRRVSSKYATSTPATQVGSRFDLASPRDNANDESASPGDSANTGSASSGSSVNGESASSGDSLNDESRKTTTERTTTEKTFALWEMNAWVRDEYEKWYSSRYEHKTLIPDVFSFNRVLDYRRPGYAQVIGDTLAL